MFWWRSSFLVGGTQDVIHKLNKYSAGPFPRNDGGDEKKQLKLQESIRNLQVKLFQGNFKVFSQTFVSPLLEMSIRTCIIEGSHDVDVSVYTPQLALLKQDFDAGVVSAKEYELKRWKRHCVPYQGFTTAIGIVCWCLWYCTWMSSSGEKGNAVRAENPYEEDGSLSFDLFFLNDIAVVNSLLLQEYSSIWQ